MAVSTSVYNPYKLKLIDGSNINLSSGGDTIKVSLHTSTYTPDIDTHEFYDDLTNELASGNGYTTGGEALTTQTTAQNDANDEARADADNVQWTFTGSKTARYAVFRKDTGTGSTSPLLFYVDFGEDLTTTNSTLTLTLDAQGYLNIN